MDNWILYLKAVVFGIVEGATEFIPVSSTGHLILFQNWLKFTGEKANAFIIFIQLGAILAVIWSYRAKLLHVALTMFREAPSRRLVINLVAATLPAVIIGLPTDQWIEARLFKPLPVALALVAGGLIILWIEKHRPEKPLILSVDQIPLRTALTIGLIQVLSILFPGLSRSGTTIMGALALGLSRVAAAEFSFFLAIPALTGASLVKLVDARNFLTVADIPLFGLGFLTSFIVALVVIRLLLALVSQKSFVPFAWYRIIFGILLLLIYSNNLAGF